MGCKLVVFPELALTTFFPRWHMERDEEIDAFFETEMPSAETQPLFEQAARLRVRLYLGYAELTIESGRKQRFNTSILVDGAGRIIGKYRKIHLPGHAEHEPWRPFQHLEKRYFEIGNLGFGVWRAFGGITGMCICNDRRWPETYRVMGLQGVEMVLLGYNTPVHNPPAPEHDHLGPEEGVPMVAQSQIIAPSGETIAMTVTDGDELIVTRCDLDLCNSYKSTMFNFAVHRVPEAYRLICERQGAIPPD
jgi:predicted amidohydrolase